MASTSDLEATQLALAQARSDLDAANQRLTDLEGRLSTTQATLEESDEALQTSLNGLTEGRSAIESSVGSVRANLSDAEERLADRFGGLDADVGRMRSDLLTNKNNISDTRDALAAGRLEVAAVTDQSDDLKASFLLTRDTVAENRADIETARTSSAEAEQITLVSHLFVIWLQTTYDTAAEGAVQEALRRSIVATGNIALEEAWAEIPSSLGLYAQVQTDDALEDFPDKLDVFHDPLSRRLVDALGG